MRTYPLLALACLAAASTSGAQHAPDITPYLMSDRAAEIAMARTAAPPSVSAKASVLVLTRNGFVEAEHGTNGFTCAVMRSFAASPGDPKFWDPTIRGPHCFNPPAVKTILPALLARMSQALAGASQDELRATEKHAYASHKFPPPAPGAMVYMLSPLQHLSASDPHWMPHLMLYYDRSLTASTFGAGDSSAPVIDANGDTTDPIQVIFIPVRTWSDGTTAMHMASKSK